MFTRTPAARTAPRLTPVQAVADQTPGRQSPLDWPLFHSRYGTFTLENVPYFLFHLTPLLAFTVPFQWQLVGLAVALYYLRMFAITGFYHRYFSHRGYRVRSRLVQFGMAFWGATALQQGPLWWANHHRYHHRHSDTPRDLHSPRNSGFWYSHTFWFLLLKNNASYQAEQHAPPKDLARFPELVWLDRYFYLPPVALALVLLAVGGWSWVVWGFFVSTVVLWHGTFTINSLSHLSGSRRFETGDTSRNNIWLALITLGEGWHNNHHAYAGGARAGFYWYEFDPTYYALWIMEKLRLISDLGRPPDRILARGRRLDRLRARARRLVRRPLVGHLDARELRLLVGAARCCVERHVLRGLGLEELRQLLARYAAARGSVASASAGPL